VQRFRAFTLIEIALSIFILMLLLLLAVPSLSGVIASRRLKQSLDSFNQLVRQAQEYSVTERRPYLIAWGKNSVLLRPEVFAEGEEEKPTSVFRLPKGNWLTNTPLNGYSGRQGTANRRSSSLKVPLARGRRITHRSPRSLI
jgi:type II secretory pathway pseudopilin PulG